MRIFLIIDFLLFGFLSIQSQTIVSTSIENKNVLIEEFTGIHCPFCSYGHIEAQSIMDAHPNDVFVINYHVWGFAIPEEGEPDFRNDYNDAIVSQSGATGIPTASVNRHYFAGGSIGEEGTTAQSRCTWDVTTNFLLVEEAYVNISVEASVDIVSRELTIHVEAYYTSDSPNDTNYLNVALLQDNTFGPQSGVIGDYNHMHRFVDFITGQWGEQIDNTVEGTFVDRTYIYNIPNDYNNVEAVLENINVVAFISEKRQEIANVTGCNLTYTNITDTDLSIENVYEIPDMCSNVLNPTILVKNYGVDIHSFVINYSINDGEVTGNQSWSDLSLDIYDTFEITLDEISFSLEETNTISFEISKVNSIIDTFVDNNTASISFNKATELVDDYLRVFIITHSHGENTTWNITNSENSIIASGGPYENNTTYNEFLSLDQDCYLFTVYDSEGEGNSTIALIKSDNTGFFYEDHGGYEESIAFSSLGSNSINIQSSAFSNVVIFPNPSNSIINMNNAEGIFVSIFDAQGKNVVSQKIVSNEEQINISKFQIGVCYVKLYNEKDSRIVKIIIDK